MICTDSYQKRIISFAKVRVSKATAALFCIERNMRSVNFI
nr:MAG TPA: hypothetical protein [Caudoviricetes sp.]